MLSVGLLSILKKIKEKEKETRLLILCVCVAADCPLCVRWSRHAFCLRLQWNRVLCGGQAMGSTRGRGVGVRARAGVSVCRALPCLRSGLDNAGKTTILKKFNGEDIYDIAPTLGFNIETLEYKGQVVAPVHHCATLRLTGAACRCVAAATSSTSGMSAVKRRSGRIGATTLSRPTASSGSSTAPTDAAFATAGTSCAHCCSKRWALFECFAG